MSACWPFSGRVEALKADAVFGVDLVEKTRKAQRQTAIVARQARSFAAPRGDMLEAIGYIVTALIFWFAPLLHDVRA